MAMRTIGKVIKKIDKKKKNAKTGKTDKTGKSSEETSETALQLPNVARCGCGGSSSKPWRRRTATCSGDAARSAVPQCLPETGSSRPAPATRARQSTRTLGTPRRTAERRPRAAPQRWQRSRLSRSRTPARQACEGRIRRYPTRSGARCLRPRTPSLVLAARGRPARACCGRRQPTRPAPPPWDRSVTAVYP